MKKLYILTVSIAPIKSKSRVQLISNFTLHSFIRKFAITVINAILKSLTRNTLICIKELFTKVSDVNVNYADIHSQ